MEKGIIVVDVPDDCAHCSYADSDNKNWYCKWNKKDNDDYVLRGGLNQIGVRFGACQNANPE